MQIALFALLVPSVAIAQDFAPRPGEATEPVGFYQGPMHGYTPTTIRGGAVIDKVALERLIEAGRTTLVDVSEDDRKPPNMSKIAVWLPQHRSIPGAIWMAQAGSGTSDPDFDKAFRSRFVDLTNAQMGASVVVFCHPDCWASYNAAKRLILAGYTNVSWYPEGIDDWQQTHETQVVREDPVWSQLIAIQIEKNGASHGTGGSP